MQRADVNTRDSYAEDNRSNDLHPMFEFRVMKVMELRCRQGLTRRKLETERRVIDGPH
jgi:hypothetical protein